MPKNKKKGKNSKTKKGNDNAPKRPLLLREEGQEYAKINKLLGDGRMDCLCFDGAQRIAQVRGKLRKWCRMTPDDIVLVSLREFQDHKADIIHKYFPEEIRKLQKMCEIPNNIKYNEEEEEEQDTFVFEKIQEDDEGQEEINFDTI